MEGVTDIRELEPREGEIVFLLNRGDGYSTDSVLGRFGRYFKNDIGHDAFYFDEGVRLGLPHRGIMQISVISTQPHLRENIDPRVKYGRGFPVRTDRSGFSKMNAEFYIGRENILTAIKSVPHLASYVKIFSDFFEQDRKSE